MFGILAFALAAIGLYGLMAYNVARRTSEIGLRIALGATPWQVRLLVLREATLLIAVGLVIGIPGALLGSRLLATLLFDITARDPLVLGSTIGLMIVVGCLASYLPAFRASCVDPLVTLRNE
jgi:ABC-type antimicrobial peptide transport system permease subunit